MSLAMLRAIAGPVPAPDSPLSARPSGTPQTLHSGCDTGTGRGFVFPREHPATPDRQRGPLPDPPFRTPSTRLRNYAHGHAGCCTSRKFRGFARRSWRRNGAGVTPRIRTACSGAPSCPTPVLNGQVAGFVDFYRVQPGAPINTRGDAVPDIDRDVFDGGDQTVKWFHLPIQQSVVVNIQHPVFENLPQALEIEDHAGHRIGIAFDRDLDHIVVPVPQRIRSRSVHPLVLDVRQLRRPADVRGGEFDFLRYQHAGFEITMFGWKKRFDYAVWFNRIIGNPL